MIKPVRSWVVAVTAAAVYLSCLPSVGAAAEVKATRWSDPASWPGNKIPSAGDTVEIASDKQVILDVSPPALNGITINGTLSFANTADLELTTEWIMLHGELQIGTQAKPHTRKATITLTDNIKGENLMGGMGDRGILLSGGTLNLHGNQKNTWTKLTRTVLAGSTSIQVINASGWRVGDEIVLASTDYDPRQAEQRSITAIKGNTITLDRKLDYMHFGKITFGVDERGEVGLLTRNIKIQASEDAAQSFFGGHIMAMPTSKMYVEGIELTRMGQNLTLARYPIHWHLVGDALGQYIKNAAIHHTYNRCVTVHGTHNLRVENNVTYNTVGHCFFMEDGIEHGNEFIRNLAMQTKCHTSQPCVPTNLAAAGESAGFDDRQGVRASGQTSKQVLLPSDNTVSSFWITNPDNTYRDNVAAGSDANGFWMSLPEHPNGAFLGTDASKATWPRRTALREFKGNVAHSNYDGFMIDRNIAANNTFGVTGSSHQPKLDPADATSKTVESVFAQLTAYKNRNGGIWGRGEMHTFTDLKLADNAMGYTHASGNFGRDPYTSRVLNSLFVGESENVGNPQTPAEVAYGRSLPKPQLPDFPIRGYEYYDYRHDVQNSTFVNYQDNATRKTGAISYLLFTSFGVSTENAVEGAKFVNAKPVYFPTLERKWGNDNGSSAAWKVSAIHDKDGSVSGVPNSYILINDGAYDSVAADAQACQIKPDWNAAVCKGDVGRMNFARAAGGPIAGIGAGAAGTPPAPPPQIVLSRNGKTYTVTQSSNVRSGTEIKLATAEPSLNVSLTELDKGSWVILELPGYSSATSGTALGSLDALRSASATAYYKDKDALWVKVVSDGSGASVAIPGSGTSIQVSR